MSLPIQSIINNEYSQRNPPHNHQPRTYAAKNQALKQGEWIRVRYFAIIPGLLLARSYSGSVLASPTGVGNLTLELLSSNRLAKFLNNSYDIPNATTPSSVNNRDQGPRTCHHRNTTQRSCVSHVNNMCLWTLSAKPQKDKGR